MTNHQVEAEFLRGLDRTISLRAARLQAIERAAQAARGRVEHLRRERIAVLDAGDDAIGFCHCLGFFRGSDHCQCCGCEELESTCDHVCDGIGCSTEHDLEGRII